MRQPEREGPWTSEAGLAEDEGTGEVAKAPKRLWAAGKAASERWRGVSAGVAKLEEQRLTQANGGRNRELTRAEEHHTRGACGPAQREMSAPSWQRTAA